MISRVWALVLLALVVALTAAVRIRLLGLPLERDEGEYAYAGQLILEGIPPYKLAYNMKLPGTYGAYAIALALFGPSTTAVHLGLLLVNVGAILLVFVVAERLFGSWAGVAAAASYALLSISPSVLGLSGHATHFVVLPALGGTLLLWHVQERDALWRYLWSGLLLGLSFVMKQQGMAFVLFGLVVILVLPSRKRPRSWARWFARAGLYTFGAALPFALTCLLLLRAGVFDRFWFWTFTYASQYAAEVPLRLAWPNFMSMVSRVAGVSPFLLALGALGLVAIWIRREQRRQAIFLTLFLLASMLGVCAGLFFRSHYFILVLPALTLLIGGGLSSLARTLAMKGTPAPVAYASVLVLFAMAWGQSYLRQERILTQLSPYEVSRATFGMNPFPEAVEVGRYLAARSRPSDRIAVLGSEPEIYFYAGRHSATGYIYTYGLMELQPYARRMQKEMIQEIEQSRPEYLVFVTVMTSWLAHDESEKLIMTWYPSFLSEHYTVTGIVDLLPDQIVYRWDADAASYSPRSPAAIYVYRIRRA